MKPEWQADNLQKAFAKFKELASEKLQEYDLDFVETVNTEKVILSVGFSTDNEVLWVLLDSSGNPTAIDDISDFGAMIEPVKETMRLLSGKPLGEILQEIIRAIGHYDNAPQFLEITFTIERNTGDKDPICHSRLEELLGIESPVPHQPETFVTRWDLITDFFDTLQEANLSCAIGQSEEDHIHVLESMQEQGINLANEHELYVYVMGMCNVVEVQWAAYKRAEMPLDELISSLSVVRNNLAIVRPFLPDTHFARFLN